MDAMRIINIVVIVAIVVVYLVWVRPWLKRKQARATKKDTYTPDFYARKKQLEGSLKTYSNEIDKFSEESKTLMDEYFKEQETNVRHAVHNEVAAVTAKMEAEAQAELEKSFNTARENLMKD